MVNVRALLKYTSPIILGIKRTCPNVNMFGKNVFNRRIYSWMLVTVHCHQLISILRVAQIIVHDTEQTLMKSYNCYEFDTKRSF